MLTLREQQAIICESAGIVNKRLNGCENNNIFFCCQIFIFKQKNIDP